MQVFVKRVIITMYTDNVSERSSAFSIKNNVDGSPLGKSKSRPLNHFKGGMSNELVSKPNKTSLIG